MKEFELRFLNADANQSIAFLPYGVTTIEFSVEGNDATGYVRPRESIVGSDDKKRYVGFADDTQDFLIVWGAGKEKGQQIDSEPNVRRFLQLIHLKNDHDNEKITFMHSERYWWEQKVFISRASAGDVVRMKMDKNGENRRITFEGTKLPMYYPRWFPPRSTRGEKIEYMDLKHPEISIEYEENYLGVGSSILIFLTIGDQKRKIGSVQGDLKYSYPHAEIFSLLPANGIFVLRLWLYWIHKKFDGYPFYTFDGTDKSGNDIGQFGQQMTSEIPDIERFDFVIDVKIGKIIWYGTDFHYQEYWGHVRDDVVNAKVAKDVDLVIKSISMLPFRFNKTTAVYNPIESLKLIILGGKESESLELSLGDGAQYESELKAALNIRTHVPYVENGRIDRSLISSIISK